MNQYALPFALDNRRITRDRLVTALIFALLVHGIILLGVGFVSLVPKPTHNRTVAITLVRNTRVVPPPRNIDYLAQINQRGPGNTRRHAAPELALGAGGVFPPSELKLAAAFRPLPPALRQLFQSTARYPESTRDTLISSTVGQRPAAGRSAPHPGNRPALLTRLVPPSRIRGIDSRSPIVTLPRFHGKQPRHRADTTNTRASIFAPYLEAWRERIEVVGNTHYSALVPPQIKRGHVTLTITLNADGSIQSIRPMRHSRYPGLDAAALKIIRLAAPFPPFPPIVRKRTEQLTFTYQWNFIRGRETPGSIGLNPRD